MTHLFFNHPFRDFYQLQKNINDMFVSLPGQQTFPLVNLWGSEEGLVLSAELPGVDTDSLSLSVHKNTLTISGTRNGSDFGQEKNVNVLNRERKIGAFRRSITLPFAVDSDKISARSDCGVLFITLPKPEAEKPKHISIKTQ